MTTLRRLMVADYPIRLFLLALAVWSVAADVCAQSPVKVGYYDMGAGAGIPEQVPPIVSAGLTPVLLDNVTATDLAGLHILFAENPSTAGYAAEYRASALGAIKDAVAAGLVLIIHDRSLNGSTVAELGTRFILPLPAGVPFPIVSSASSNDNNVSDAATLVASGPAGIITDTNLDNGVSSNQGSVPLTFIPGRKALLHRGTLALANNNAVTFSYPFGLGFVIYSSIPLDVFLKDMGMATPAVRASFRNIYAPNVLAYAACGLRAFPATVTATSATGHYGGTATLSANVKCGVIPVAGVSINFSLNGVPAGSATTDASGTATLVNASLGSSPASAIAVGSYPAGVAAAFGGTAQYGASSGTALLTVDKAPASISFDGSTFGTFVYNAASHAANGSVTGVFGEPLGAPSFSYTDKHGVASDVAPVNVGAYRVTASVPESANYLGTTAESGPKIKITPASLVVTAQDKTKLYGAALPVLTATYQGFVGAENASVLAGTLQLATNATAASPVDEYSITPSGVTSNNYDIEFVGGILAVTPAALTVRAADTNKIYGAELPAFTAGYEGFVLSETVGALAGSLYFVTSATESSAVGTYDVTPSGLHSHNYAIGFVAGTLTVSPAALTVRADDKTKVYGATLPALTASYNGFVLHDGPGVLEGSLLLTTGVTAASGVGAYAITPSGLSSTNYTISFVQGTLAVTPTSLTVQAEDSTKLYGAALPTFTARYEGFVLGETPGALAGTLAFQTNATMRSHVGPYAVTPSGLTSRNYNIAFADGYLMVKPAPLTIRANDKERLVEKMNPLLTVSYDGFVLDDTEGILDVRPSVATTATASSPVGTYPIVAAGASDSDYTIVYLNGDLTVSPEGRVHGSGFVDGEGGKHHFVFDARETIVLGEMGSLSLRVERITGSDVFVSQVVTSVVFSNNFGIAPGGKAVVDGVAFTGLGTWNGIAATFEVLALDKGEPGVGSDTITIGIKVAGRVVNMTQGVLSGGNIQSNRVK